MAIISLATIPCIHICNAMDGIDWDTNRWWGDTNIAQWEEDGDKFYEAANAAPKVAVDEQNGKIDGDKLADLLDAMATIEKRWGDDPLTAKLRLEIARVLDWDITDRDLLTMLRAGKE